MSQPPQPQVLYSDADLLVVDKPANLVCHSASRPGQRALVDWVREQGVDPPRLLNRLDRETSGVVVVSRHERAAKILGKQMLRHELDKEYLAICWGRLGQDQGVIEQPIAVAADAVVYTRRMVSAAGQPCVTRFEVVERLAGFTLVRLWPRTGRAHQLRVHLQWLGHPIVGDKIYGPDERLYLEFIENGVTEPMLEKLLMPRQALHAAALTLRHPSTGERMSFGAPLPADMREFLEQRRRADPTRA